MNSTKDFKTKLFDSHRNLPSFLTVLPEVVELLRRDSALGILYINGTELKVIEEKYGSRLFDDIMINISRMLSNMRGSIIRKTDILTLTEVQGYSFIVFMSEARKDKPGVMLSKDDVEKACERVQSYLHSTLFFELYNYLKGLPRISVGYSFCVYNPMIKPWRAVYNLIDEAKKIGDLQMAQLELKNRGRLQKVILEEQVSTVYQPILDLKTEQIMGYESLSRGPKHSEIEAPVILFTLAEETGLVFELDRLCRKRSIINARGKKRGLKLFVNTLPNLIYDPDFEAKLFIKFLESNDIPINDIVFEITERNAIEQFSNFRQAISYYTDVGITIAIDDVGAGYSSLEAIIEIKPAYVKIDASVTRGVAESAGKQQMLKALHSLSQSVGAKTIAEGIETRSDFDTIQQIGIEYGQGYYICKPGPAFPEVHLHK